ncbi:MULTISPECIES: TetR/AcrR family transcriptional regulator [Actinomycetes]|uniref:AcrR family transcriptional regulator n=1 Tax=Nocardiopsis metallicus TaxID=179819 RepID=A0A840WRS0_9ACTN|nr:TetR/AcrR family transcriptional regulator [Nocardiopsis metallicus]MBB5494257.1 AcrR family transcriptional regulator [Nocardiopsis metallicus]
MSETSPGQTRSDEDRAPERAPRKRVNRREQILRTAADVFSAQGFNNTSLADIAAMLDITPAGVLHHFGSKTDLLTAVLELRDDDEPAPEGGGMLDHLVTTAQRNAERPGTTQLYAVLSAESATAEHPAQEWFRERYTVLRQEVEDAVLDRIGPEHRTAASTPGPSGHSPARSAAAAVLATMDGLQVQWLLDPEAVDMAAVTELVIDAIVAKLSASVAGGGVPAATGNTGDIQI